MKSVFRWVLLLIGALALGFVLVIASLATKDAYLTQRTSLFIFIFMWLVVWLGTGFFLKKQGKVKQPFAQGFLPGMIVSGVFLSALSYLTPSHEELLEKAQKAEQEYFLLSAGSLNHNRICSAAREAYLNYDKAKMEDKTKLFEYIIITDKCL
jgi:energy-coupling factor transporter transmembrane protein EcfT